MPHFIGWATCFSLVVLGAVAGGCAQGPAPPSGLPSTDASLRAELLRMGKEDQAARAGFAAAAAANDRAYGQRLRAGDSARSARLRQIVSAHGWPGRGRVGEDGVRAALLVLQHSPSVEFQRELLPQLEAAARRGDVAAADVATLTDQVLVSEGKPQRYGSSFSVVRGRLVPHPIDDEVQVDERRAAVGLPPMADYVRLLQDVYNLPVEWPRRP